MRFKCAAQRVISALKRDKIRKLAALAPRPGAGVSLIPEEKYIQEVLAGGPPPGDEYDLPFLNSDDLKNAHLIMDSQQQIIVDARGLPYSTTCNVRDIYGVDGQGNLYVMPREEIGEDQLSRTRGHPALFSGKAGKCFGEIEIVDGKINYINNRSGHYMPNEEAFLEMVKVFSLFHSEPLKMDVYRNKKVISRIVSGNMMSF